MVNFEVIDIMPIPMLNCIAVQSGRVIIDGVIVCIQLRFLNFIKMGVAEKITWSVMLA